jgi:hypothetical protein
MASEHVSAAEGSTLGTKIAPTKVGVDRFGMGIRYGELSMDRFCANEDDYHQRVIQSMGGFPKILRSQDGVEAFVWGHELDLHDAGRGGGNGSADLLTADEYGMVWLIEAKFDKTYEKGDFVWGSQLKRYREAISKMEWQDILLYASKFLRWEEKTKPAFHIPSLTDTFTRVLEIWQAHTGRALVSPHDLNNRIAAHLKRGTYGIMVLTDIIDASYEERGRHFVRQRSMARTDGKRSRFYFRIFYRRPRDSTVA